MPQQHIHCSVNNCHYWSQGNICSANEIVIVDDSFGAKQPDRIDHNMAKQITPTPVESCMDTCCKTFVHKNDPDIKVDSTYRI